MNGESGSPKQQASERVLRVEWMLYVIGAIAGVAYVGPFFGKLTGYYEGLFSLVFVVAFIGLVHVLKPILEKLVLEKIAGEKNVRE